MDKGDVGFLATLLAVLIFVVAACAYLLHVDLLAIENLLKGAK